MLSNNHLLIAITKAAGKYGSKGGSLPSVRLIRIFNILECKAMVRIHRIYELQRALIGMRYF